MFLNWKSDPVTKFIFEELEYMRTDLEESLSNPTAIMKPDGQLQLARWLGKIEGITAILEVDINDPEEGIYD